MSSSPDPSLIQSRRRFVWSLTTGAAAAVHYGCEGCVLSPGQAILLVLYYGQAASSILRKAIEAQIRRDQIEHAQSAANGGFPPPSPPQTTNVPSGGDLTGVAAGSASGPPPPGGGPTLREEGPRQSASRRAAYLLDTLGDAQVDGRVYAFEVTDEAVALRGQVGLRPTDSSLPFIQLRHIALSPDGAQLVVSQQGAPSQWIFLDAASLTITKRIMAPEGQNARRAVFSPDGAIVYLLAGTNSTTRPPARLTVADAVTRSLIGAIELPSDVTLDDLAPTPDGGLLIGASGLFLHSIDVRSATYGGRVLVARPTSDPAGPQAGSFQRIAMDPFAPLCYASGINYQAENRYAIGVFDVRSLSFVDEITVREPPTTGAPLMRLTPSGGTLLYAPQLGTGIQVFDTPSRTEMITIPVEASFRLTELTVA